jgi:hypothetical protein
MKARWRADTFGNRSTDSVFRNRPDRNSRGNIRPNYSNIASRELTAKNARKLQPEDFFIA